MPCRQAGKVEQANGGTLLLDEIGDMPLRYRLASMRQQGFDPGCAR